MSRIALPPLISPGLFRHFAVVTVMFTVLIAIIADGESREAITDEVAAREAKNEQLRIEAKKLGPRKIEFRNHAERYRAKPFESEGGMRADGFGEPMDSGAEGGGGGAYLSSDFDDGPAPIYSPPVLVNSPQTQGQQPVMGQDGQPGPMPPPPQKKQPFKPTPDMIAQTLAASRARSGGDSSDDFR